MNSDALSGLAGMSILLAGLVAVFLLVLAALWTLVPFAIFGIKPLLRQLIAQSSRTNDLLEELKLQRRPSSEITRVESV